MGRGALLVENFFSEIQFPGHAVVADEEGAGREAFRIATGRRSPYTNYYESITANVQRTITVTCDRTRMANGFALDRGLNLAGKQVVVECSDDNFVTPAQTAFDAVLPTMTAPGSLDDALGVRTEEGAHLARFAPRPGRYWRIRIPALGVGIKPKIVGAMLGMWYPFTLRLPDMREQDELVGEESLSDGAWRGMGAPANVRTDLLRLKFSDLFEYESARYHLNVHFGRRRPMWLVHDDAQADRAVLAIRPTGRQGFVRSAQWFYHQADIPWVEHEAMRVA